MTKSCAVCGAPVEEKDGVPVHLTKCRNFATSKEYWNGGRTWRQVISCYCRLVVCDNEKCINDWYLQKENTN